MRFGVIRFFWFGVGLDNKNKFRVVEWEGVGDFVLPVLLIFVSFNR